MHDIGKSYGGEACLLKYFGRYRISLNIEGLGYTPKNGKAAFATRKTNFVKGNGHFVLKMQASWVFRKKKIAITRTKPHLL